MTPHELLETIVKTAAPRLVALGGDDSATMRKPGGWTRKQIVGHLVDSACNNHGRFVRAQRTDDLVFPGYDQEAWVAAQRYDEAAWDDLVELWRRYNLHLARIIAAIPRETMTRTRARHSLDAIAWRRGAPTEPVTLEYLVRDYIGHLENHLLQLLDDYEPVSISRP